MTCSLTQTLLFCNATEYKDDNTPIQRSSTVIVRRLPPSKPGRGTAQSYVADLQAEGAFGDGSRFGPGASGAAQRDDPRQRGGPTYRGPMSMRFDDRQGSSSATPAPSATPQPALPSSITEQNSDEAAGIAAMFQATTDQWDATQQQMAHATYRSRGGGPSRGGPPSARGGFAPRGGGPGHGGAEHFHSDRPPPIGYICFRCGQKGHWIQECPTNQDPEWDNKPRFKRTTGIPKSMLKTVEQPTDEQRQAGVMITADGTYVVAQVDSATWEKERAQGVKALSKSDVYQAVPSDNSLACPLCSKLLRNAVQTPCCSTRFCEECIQTHLLEHDFACAECDRRIADLGNLKRDDETRRKVEQYVQDAVEKSEGELKEREEKEEEEAKKRKEEEEKATAAAAAAAAQSSQEASKELGKDTNGGATAEASNAAGSTNMPANVPMVAFNPQLVQQLVMTLSNPALPPPMRMMFQTQLQAQQMAFMRMQQGGQGAGANGGGMMMGGQQQQQQQQGHNPMMMGGGGGGPGQFGFQGNGNGMPVRPQQQWRGPQMGMGGMGGGMNMGMSGQGPMMQHQQQQNGMHNRGRIAGGRPPQYGQNMGGMKRGREADFVELGGGGSGGSGGEDGHKAARMA